MKVQYPLFILAKDDLSLEMALDSSQLNRCCERHDVEDGLYAGWDINGYPVDLFWDNRLKVIVKISKNKSEKDKLKEVILDYAQRYRPEALFVHSDSNDFIELFKAVEEHIGLKNKDKKGA